MSPYNQDPNVSFGHPIDDRIGKVVEGLNAAEVACRCADVRKPNQQAGDTFELIEETVCQFRPTLASIEASCLKKVKLRPTMKAVTHSRLARIRATASGPETTKERSASASTLRFSANAFHRASRSRSASRLLMT